MKRFVIASIAAVALWAGIQLQAAEPQWMTDLPAAQAKSQIRE